LIIFYLKRISRQNITFRNKERQREVESKRKARQCEEVRQKECVENRLPRLNITIRNKERQREVESIVLLFSLTLPLSVFLYF
jgi:DNA polymerase II small subunit/DNA polymerase delta subunit B